ncbi:MAG: hypothetical protein K1W28_01595 [Lachnospiraceae bacterium]
MADNQKIDTLTIEINSDAAKAEQSIRNLADALVRLASGTSRGLNNLRTVAGDIKQLSNATKGLDTSKLSAYATGMDNLSNSIGRFANIGDKITPAVNALQKLAGVDLSGMRVSGDFSGLSALAEGAGKLADTAPKLAALKASDLNRSLTAFQKLGQTDFSGVAQSLQALNGLDVSGFTGLSQAMNGFADSVSKLASLKTADISRAVKSFERLASLDVSGLAAGLQALNGVDISKISELGTAFQGFANALAGSDKIAAGTTKIFSSLATLAQSAANIPTVTANLPGLSSAVRDFIAVMASAPAVEAGIVSLVGALAQLANAGAKATKTAAALPELTAGVQAFIQMLVSMPRLDKNILRAVEALARLADAGGRAGAASRNLLQNINRLSSGMGGLRSGALGATGGLRSFAGQLLAALGITGGLYGLVRGIKASVKTASDLFEAQNVIEQGFGPLIGKIEDFAKTSIQSFGMSELAAKNTAGIYAVMAKSLGVLPDAATDMAVALTGLTGDLASFYNVSQDVANTALKSVFTGETETLKKFGIVMTQANLQAFALAQGINKSVRSMSQAELVTLRYNFVMDAASAAMGDFARTSGGSWANQIRILTEQFRQLAGIIGGGLMAVFLPVVKGINLIMSKVIQLATVLSSFLGKLFGIQKATAGGGAGLAGVADAAGLVADNTEAAAGGIADAGNAAKKAEKKVNSFAASWHEVTSVSSNESSEAGGSGGAGGVAMPDMSLPAEYEMEITVDDEVSPVLEAIRNRFQELAGLFIKGFRVGLGDTSVFDSIRNNLLNIRTSLLDIFTDDAVVTAFNHLLDTLAYNAGLKVGAFVSIGATIADNLTGGIALYLESAKDRIKDWIIRMPDIAGETDTIVSNFTVAVSDIFTVFRSDDAKSITRDIIQLFLDGFMGVSELAASFGRDILGLLLNPITENAEGFKEALQNTLSPIAEITGTIADSFTRLWNTVRQTYDEHIAPMFQAFTEGLSQIIETLLSGYNEHIAPVLSRLADKFTEVWDGVIHPMLENFIGLFGDVTDFITAIWNSSLQPFVAWIEGAIRYTVAPVLGFLGDVFLETFSFIGKILDGFVTSCRGILQFLTGAFTNDWSKMWDGIKNIFKGIWDMLPLFVTGPVKEIIGSVNKMIKAIEDGINFVIRGLNKFGGELFGISIGEVSFPRIPMLAKGGVVDQMTLALIGESGKEAVLPLDRNTGWMTDLSARISENIKRDFGDARNFANITSVRVNVPVPDYSIPESKGFAPQYSEADMGRLKTTLQMEMDEKMAQMAYENRQLQDAVERNTQILEKILAQGVVLDDNNFTDRYKRAASKFMDRNHYEMGLYPAGR